MQEVREAIDRLTVAVEAQGSDFDVWSGIIIPLLVSAVSSGLVIFVLMFQHRARIRELEQEATMRAEERREQARAVAKAAKRRAGSAFISALNVAYTQNPFGRSVKHADAAKTRLAEAISSVQDAAMLDLGDEDMQLLRYTERRLVETFRADSSRESLRISRETTSYLRRSMLDELKASELTQESVTSASEN